MSETKSKLPQSMNAVDWADEWLEIIAKNPTIPTDRDTMISWFANAIMCGWDHRTWRYDADYESLTNMKP
jgi:hypothetical protein